MTDQPARISAVMIDCHDPESLVEFWSAIAGVEAEYVYPDYIFTSKIPGNHIRLAFQRVPEDKVVKNRLHLDLAHPKPETLIAKVIELGGSRRDDHDSEGTSWTVLTDPEGNEFCITGLH
jgi:predicted enzyme related to lactoylglutathione lyase